MDFVSGNRWRGVIAGQDVNVYAGTAGSMRMGTGKVIVDIRAPGSGHPLVLNRLARHTGPLMIVAAPAPRRLTLWDAHGYRHTLILAGPRTRLYQPPGPPAAVPADAVLPTAGICAQARNHLVTVGIAAEAAYPRCARVFADEALRVENRSDDQPPRMTVTLRFPTVPASTVRPGESVVFAHPFARLAPGVHRIHLGPYTADIWVR